MFACALAFKPCSEATDIGLILSLGLFFAKLNKRIKSKRGERVIAEDVIQNTNKLIHLNPARDRNSETNNSISVALERGLDMSL